MYSQYIKVVLYSLFCFKITSFDCNVIHIVILKHICDTVLLDLAVKLVSYCNNIAGNR